MKLYIHPISGHAHRAHTFAALIGADVDIIEVDLTSGAQKTPEFLALNRFGQVPVLVDGDTVVADSNAILVYLAKKHGRTDWLPDTAEGAAAVQRWLSVAAGLIAFGPAAARLITLFGAGFNADEVITRAHGVLSVIEEELDRRNWILGGAQPTIADIALYSYIARAPEGDVDLQSYTNIRSWLARIEGLDGFVPFMMSPVGLAQKA